MAQNPNLSHLDPGQIPNRVFDPLNDRIRVDAEVTAVIPGPVEVAISHTDDSIRIGDGTNLVTATVIGPDVGLDVNIIAGSITGTFTPSGLTVAGSVKTLDISSTAIAIPATALSMRNSLSLTNLSLVDILYVGFTASVTADRALGSNAGWEVGPNEGFNLDIKDNIVIYGITEVGKTVRVKIMELA